MRRGRRRRNLSGVVRQSLARSPAEDGDNEDHEDHNDAWLEDELLVDEMAEEGGLEVG